MSERWPELPLEAWQDTYGTLHRWTQIVGKVRLAQSPWVNHSWHVPLYVTSRGLTTSPIPYGDRTFQIDFDFFLHELVINTGEGQTRRFGLRPMSVAEFYRAIMAALTDLGLAVHITPRPCELPDATRFDQDTEHASYAPEYVHRLWQILAHTDRILKAFRARFLGKVSPVHFFWGSFDMAVTRFSGRTAPPHPGGVPHLSDEVVRDAYSHEVSSAGFWPGGNGVQAAFYSYAYPEPAGYKTYSIAPDMASYSNDLREFVLPYQAARQAKDPDATLLTFLQSTYEAAADLGHWDRAALERAATAHSLHA
ncbi:MAG TPA: DUF5996 family protein [Candidatus Xenobia bacterium]|jgi:hypothetical protein